MADNIDLRDLARLASQFLRVRSIRRGLVAGVVMLVIVVWMWSGKKTRATSAVGCKNRLPEVGIS